MSLVEKALEKMQAAGKAQNGQVVAAKSIGRGVTPEVRADVPRNPPPPARVVSFNRALLRHSGMLPPEHEENGIARQYRAIKRPLVSAAFGRGMPALPNGRMIMVASALSGDGKTFTAVNLALSIAKEREVNVVLADADVAKRHLSSLLDVANEPGLLDALSDLGRDVDSLLLPTDVPSLSVLPAGHRDENATELLSSSRMGEVTRQLASRDPHRMVIFDSPPLMLTTESQALADSVGHVVMVVRAGVTPQNLVLDALASLGERPVSLLLNQSVTGASGDYYYGYPDSREGGST